MLQSSLPTMFFTSCAAAAAPLMSCSFGHMFPQAHTNVLSHHPVAAAFVVVLPQNTLICRSWTLPGQVAALDPANIAKEQQAKQKEAATKAGGEAFAFL